VDNTDLRPLGAGEILDRAVTLYVRRFVAIVSVLAVVTVPLLLIEMLVAPGRVQVFADLGGLLQAGGDPGKVRAATAAVMRDSHWTGTLLGFNLGAAIVRVLMWNALLVVVASAHGGLRTALGDAYFRAARCWLAQLVVAVVYVALAAIAAVPLLLAYLAVIVVVIGVSFTHSVPLTATVGIVLGVALLAVAVGVMAWLLMAYELAAVAVATETSNPVTAVETALRRALGRTTRWRTLLAGLVLLAVIYGAAIPIGIAAALVGLVAHEPVLTVAVTGVGNVVLEGLTAAFVVVFALDVRVRREGLDLAALVEAPA
jgi:hypothetical protein